LERAAAQHERRVPALSGDASGMVEHDFEWSGGERGRRLAGFPYDVVRKPRILADVVKRDVKTTRAQRPACQPARVAQSFREFGGPMGGQRIREDGKEQLVRRCAVEAGWRQPPGCILQATVAGSRTPLGARRQRTYHEHASMERPLGVMISPERHFVVRAKKKPERPRQSGPGQRIDDISMRYPRLGGAHADPT